MKTTSGVGRSDLAFQRSSTFRWCGPYLTFARSGSGLSFCCWAMAGARSKGPRHSAKKVSLTEEDRSHVFIISNDYLIQGVEESRKVLFCDSNSRLWTAKRPAYSKVPTLQRTSRKGKRAISLDSQYLAGKVSSTASAKPHRATA